MSVVHYVEYWTTGMIVGENRVREIARRDTKLALRGMQEHEYAFRFFDRTERKEGGETLCGPRKNASGFFYPGGKIETLEEIRLRGDPKEETLVRNMENNDWPKVVWSRHGGWPQPLSDGDVIIPQDPARAHS